MCTNHINTRRNKLFHLFKEKMGGAVDYKLNKQRNEGKISTQPKPRTRPNTYLGSGDL